MSQGYDPDMLRFALKRSRDLAELTQDEASRLSGVPKSRISTYEQGVTNEPRFDIVARLAYVYGVSLDQLAAECGLPTRVTAAAPPEGEPVPIADPRLRAVVQETQSTRDIGWRDNLITTLYLLMASRTTR